MPDNRFFEKLISLVDKLSKYKTTVMTMAVVVVFVVTYLLILPAFTLEKTEAEKQGGIDIGTQSSAEISEESADIDADGSDAEAADANDAKDSGEADTVTDAKVTSDAKKNTTPDSDESGKATVKSESESPETATATDHEEAETIVSGDDLAGSLTFEGDGFSVAVEDTAGILPSDTSVEAAELVEEPTEGTKAERKAAAEEYSNYYDKALEAINDETNVETEKKISFVKFYDITLQSGENAIQPEKPVNVTISYDKQQQKDLKVEEKKDVRIIHFIEDEKTGEITAEILDDKDVDVTLEKSRITDTTFEAEGFSVYGIVYTVDFHWDVDGKKFDFSIPGGGFVSLEHIVEVLGINGASENLGSVFYEEAAVLNELEVSEGAKKFVANVENVGFSNPELVWVGKAEYETTVGELKETNGLNAKYSSDLTEEQITEIDTQTVEAGDWALISLQPFTSEETLTVTMKNGDQFVVKVTDAQISTNVLTADGKTYKITVTFDDDAEIPAGTKLVVREIEKGTHEFQQFVGKTWIEVNKDYFEQEELYSKDEDYIPKEIPLINIDQARFFDITLMHGEVEIEPNAPVQVSISYEEGLGVDGIEERITGVSHFKSEEGIELIAEIEIETDEEGRPVEYHYNQDSFSVIGTYIGHEVRNSEGELSVPEIKLNTRGTKGTDILETPNPQKTLLPNIKSDGTEDGTYKLSLSVTGDKLSSTKTEAQKSNVLFIMDRSSSMRRDVGEAYIRFKNENDAIAALNNGTLVYGDVNGGHPSLRYSEGRWQYQQMFTILDYDIENGLYYRLSGSRLKQEQAALGNLLTDLMSKNSGEGNSDNIEVAIISFATHRGDQETRTYYGNDWGTTEVDWQSGVDTTVLTDGVDDSSIAAGTNWEEALKYAKEVMDTKKAAEEAAGHDDEDYYIIFLTDGAPTATTYSITQEDGAYYGTEGHYSWQLDGQGRPRNSCEPAYEDARDDALALVNAGYKLYNIYTYGSGSDIDYMRRLTNYAYTNGGNDTNGSTEYLNKFFTNATDTEKLVEAFQNIFSEISVTQAHVQVKITDGLRQDAMTFNITDGKPTSASYTVTPDGSTTPLYTVTATMPDGAEEPVVTFKFKINGEDVTYSTENEAESEKVKRRTKEPVDGDPLASYDAGEYYYVTLPDGTEYRMALATVDNSGELTWDLQPVGALMDDCTYKAEFIVWPNQDAYDYVSALNNGLTEIEDPDDENADPIPVVWNQSAATQEVDSKNKVYYTGGCTKYPSIVYYPDPDKEDDPDNHMYYGTFAVLTNTDQHLDYSIVTTEDGEVTSVVPQDPIPMEFPDPMPLEDTGTFILKKWIVDRDAGVLAQYLYDLEGNPKKFRIKFDIYQGEVTDSSDPYTSVSIGWDETAGPDGQGAYVWEGPFVDAEYGDNTYTIGTHWKADFDISSGLMLSDGRMDELKLEKSNYSSATFGGVTYYILEHGHDYTIKEDGDNIGYEFDFDSPVYHPMLVDGVMKNVKITKNGNNYIINNIAPTPLDSLGLKIENNLRAYLHLNKVVLDRDDRQLTNDKTRFEYTVNIHSPIKLEGTHIPWYAVNDLFYHDEDFNYYQADPIFEGENQVEGVLTLKTESGFECQATCEGMFDPDISGPTTIHYFDENEKEQEIELYGNTMTAAFNLQDIQATFKINQDERLTIANIPAESTYSITENQTAGYELAGIEADPSAVQNGYIISGTILQNADNNVTYKNRLKSGSLKLTKIVQIDGAAPASDKYSLVDGDYIFTVENAEDNTFEVKKYVQITVENGNAISYRIADTEDALSDAEEVTGSWAILTDLAAGDYVITETAERNGLLLTDIARGDASETAVDLDNSKVMVHVTSDDTDANQPGAQATFTNNYYNNEEPDRIALDIVKTFNGLVSQADLPDNFRVVICYSLPESDDPIEIELKKGQYETIETADGEHIKVRQTTDGFTLSWHITNIPSSASSFKIKEANYDSVTGYTFTAATLDSVDITETAGSWHDMSVAAPTASLSNVTSDRRTSDSGSNVQFVLEDGDILLSKLTANQGTLVISKHSLNMLEREAVVAGWPSQGGFKKPPRYFSIEEHQDGFKYGGKEISFSVRETDVKTIVTFTHDASAQEAVFSVTYDSHSSLNNAVLTNTYIQKEVTLELIKVDSTNMTTPLENAQFTLKKLDPEGRGNHLTGTDAVEKVSNDTNAEGIASITGITDGYYEISETKVPAGYILVDGGSFYIKVVNGEIIRIAKAKDDPETEDIDEGLIRNWPEITDNTGNIQFVSTLPAVPDDPETEDIDESAEAKTTYKVGNTPGASLPNSGGIGTTIFYVLGSLLVLGCGIYLIACRRMNEPKGE